MPLHEVRLANGRRADILALRPDGGFVCIEIYSGLADFRADQKWPDYRDYADALCFAVDADFPLDVLPDAAGLIACGCGPCSTRSARPPCARNRPAPFLHVLRRTGGR